MIRKTLYSFLLFFISTSLVYTQNRGHSFTINGDFDGDDEDETVFEEFTDQNQKSIDKNYSMNNVSPSSPVATCYFSTSKRSNIPPFEAAKGKNHAGFALLHTIGDLDNDGGEEVGYVIQWLDHSNLNTYHIISLKNGKWVELYKFSIRDYQLPKLPKVNYNATSFGNTTSYNDNIDSGKEMDEILKREKELDKFKGFVKKLSLFNILVQFVNDNGVEEYTLWNLKSRDKTPKSNLDFDEAFLILGEEVRVPTFTLDLKISPEVEKLLKSKREEIIVSIDIYGEPVKRLDQAAEKYLDDYKANLFIGNFKFKLDKAEKLIVEKQVVPKIGFENLKNPNFMVSVNVFSSRKSSENNIFDASYLGEKIANLQGKIHEIRVKMLK